jgi:tRNA pseudouridine38-40 synthase
MRNIKITIEYDGTNYCGWQVQKNAVAVQEVLQRGIETLLKHEINITGSSRTDAGVHAKGMVANFFTSISIPVENFPAAINTKLPLDIVVLKAEEVDHDFHSRYSNQGKRYSYCILNRKMPSAILRNYTAHIPEILDFKCMEEACKEFVGTHDFSSFKSSGSIMKDNVRTIKLLDIKQNEDIIKIIIEADGFLYNMVRIIAGTLIDVGKGKIKPDEISNIILSQDRKKAGKTAPPQGLYLDCVYYRIRLISEFPILTKYFLTRQGTCITIINSVKKIH